MLELKSGQLAVANAFRGVQQQDASIVKVVAAPIASMARRTSFHESRGGKWARRQWGVLGTTGPDPARGSQPNCRLDSAYRSQGHPVDDDNLPALMLHSIKGGELQSLGDDCRSATVCRWGLVVPLNSPFF